MLDWLKSFFRGKPAAGQSAEISGDDNTIIQASGSNIQIYINAQIKLDLELVPHRLNLPPAKTEVDLLNPYRRTLELLGRDADLAGLHDFLANPDRPISVRTIIGRAGAGKTRLAVELMLKLADPPYAARQWTTGFLKGDALVRFAENPNLAQWGWPTPTLIVIDYAATLLEPLKKFLNHLADRTTDAKTPPLRILLLEREASDKEGWLSTLVGHSWTNRVAMLFDPFEPIRVKELDTPVRRQLFSAMLAKASKTLGVPAPAIPSPGENAHLDRQFENKIWEDPLYLMMAAVVALRANISEALSLSRPDLALNIAHRELERIESFASAEGPLDQQMAARHLLAFLAAHATLNAGLFHKDALTLANAECEAQSLTYPGGPGALVHRLHEALPAPNQVIAPVLPDIIGEALVLHVLRRLSKADQAAFILRSLQTRDRAVPATIIRTAQDFSSVGASEPLDWLEAMLETGRTDDIALLVAIEDVMPHQTLVLREKAAEVTSLLLRNLKTAGEKRTSDEIRIERARLLNNFSNRLSDLGRCEEALATAQEAVEIYRQLAAELPDMFRQDLATCLNNLAVRLSESRRHEDALLIAQETVDIRRQLAKKNPDVFLPDLAASLNNLANRIGELGRHEDALPIAKEAVDIHRQLAAERPDVFSSGLATSLNNLAGRFSELDYCENALSAAQEATAIRHQLAAQRPDAFSLDLVQSFGMLASIKREMGDNLGSADLLSQAITHLAPIFLKLPQPFFMLMSALCRDYLKSCEGAGLALDEKLLGPLIPVFNQFRPPNSGGAANDKPA